ncbi:hypothetical protein L3V81_12605 [Thiotrichales bacterium 19S3-11]|nr:hypothetical protein [Thiotrichales bacterium 19S3-11]
MNTFNYVFKKNIDLLGFIDVNKDNNKPFNEVMSIFEKKYLSTIPYFNQYSIMSLLYAVLFMREVKGVYEIPKEQKIGSLCSKWHLEKFTFTKDKNSKDNKEVLLSKLINNIRHGVAHGNVDCDENLIFTIKNIHKTKKSKIEIEIRIEGVDIYGFVRALMHFNLTGDLELKNL